MAIFEIIHQGPEDTIIFHIQNEKVGVNVETFPMIFLWRPSFILKQSKTPIFEKRSSGHPVVHQNYTEENHLCVNFTYGLFILL